MKSPNFHTISLGDMQREFQRSILDQQQTPPTFIIDTPGISSIDRFKVYTEAYSLRLIDALIADYPALKNYFGDDGFDTMARGYVNTWPSDKFSIRWFGRQLSRFLGETPPYDEQLELKELASFEWALSEAFDASESTSIDYQQLTKIEASHWPLIRLRFHPSLRRIDLKYNIPPIWQATNQKQSLPALKANTDLQGWVIWRKELKLLFRSIAAQEAIALDTFRQGKCFAEVCESLCEWLDEEQVAVNAAGFIQAWVRDGWITDVKIPT